MRAGKIGLRTTKSACLLDRIVKTRPTGSSCIQRCEAFTLCVRSWLEEVPWAWRSLARFRRGRMARLSSLARGRSRDICAYGWCTDWRGWWRPGVYCKLAVSAFFAKQQAIVPLTLEPGQSRPAARRPLALGLVCGAYLHSCITPAQLSLPARVVVCRTSTTLFCELFQSKNAQQLPMLRQDDHILRQSCPTDIEETSQRP